MNIQDYLKASNAAYVNGIPTVPTGWKLILHTRQTDTGYNGVAYQLPSGEILIAHAGSQPDVKEWSDFTMDWQNNIGLGIFQKAPLQYQDAQDFVFDVMHNVGKSAQIHQTGHSLGGVIAQLSAYDHGQKATVFESPGVEDILLKEGIRAPEGYSGANSIQVFNIRESSISDVGSQITDVHYCEIGLPDDTPPGMIKSHQLANFDKAFDAQGNILMTLQNPDYLNTLLSKKWDENKLIHRNRMHGDEHEVHLQDQYPSYEDFRQAYISRHSAALGLPHGASSANNAYNQKLLDIVEAKLERFIQTVEAF